MKIITQNKTYLAICAAIAMTFLAVGCSKAPPAEPPPVQLKVSRALQKDVVEQTEYPGRLESPETVTLAARVSGVITSANFQEGALVNKGDVLFIIDQRPFQAEYNSKNADLVSAQARLIQADATLTRTQKLKEVKAISDQVYDDALSSRRQAQANVSVAEAALAVAALNLDWSSVKAPISGRVGRKLITEGNLVTGGGGGATQLTSITSVDPMFCYVTIPERTFLTLKQAFDNQGNKEIPCALKLENEKDFLHDGHIDFINNQIDATTGTITIRGNFANGNGILTPGLFARLKLPVSDKYPAILVPDNVIGTDQNSRYVYTINAENVVERKQVERGSLFGPMRAITKGVAAEDRVLIEGIQKVKIGQKIAPTEVTMGDNGPIIPTPEPGASSSSSSSSAAAQEKK